MVRYGINEHTEKREYMYFSSLSMNPVRLSFTFEELRDACDSDDAGDSIDVDATDRHSTGTLD